MGAKSSPSCPAPLAAGRLVLQDCSRGSEEGAAMVRADEGGEERSVTSCARSMNQSSTCCQNVYKFIPHENITVRQMQQLNMSHAQVHTHFVPFSLCSVTANCAYQRNNKNRAISRKFSTLRTVIIVLPPYPSVPTRSYAKLTTTFTVFTAI